MTTTTLKFNTGAELPLSEVTTKDGSHTYLAYLAPGETFVSRFGFNVGLKNDLPTSATIMRGGKSIATVNLEKGVTSPNPKTGKGGGNPKVTGQVEIEHNGDTHVLGIRVSNPKTGVANILVRSARPRVGRVNDSVSL